MAVLLSKSVTIIVDINDLALSVLLWHVKVVHPGCLFAVHCLISFTIVFLLILAFASHSFSLYIIFCTGSVPL